MTPRRKRIVLAASVAVLGLWAIALVVVALQARPGAQANAPAAAQIGPAPGPFRGGPLPGGLDRKPAFDFALTDARGGTLDTRSLRGRPYVVTFLYTDCPDTCPLLASQLKAALEQLGPQGKDVTVVAVSADPAGDTRGQVRQWLQERKLPPNFRYAIGTKQELLPVWDAYYAAPQPRDEEQSAHSASIWLVDADNRLRTKFSAGFGVPPSDIAHDLRILLEES
ncbi:MAG TPA: SCO family protein [Solirubrobacteraceae bacterium]|nr:SCO family protein [Solirubrobacteraceae bacterium]